MEQPKSKPEADKTRRVILEESNEGRTEMGREKAGGNLDRRFAQQSLNGCQKWQLYQAWSAKPTCTYAKGEARWRWIGQNDTYVSRIESYSRHNRPNWYVSKQNWEQEPFYTYWLRYVVGGGGVRGYVTKVTFLALKRHSLTSNQALETSN